jgi:hypothetical protein
MAKQSVPGEKLTERDLKPHKTVQVPSRFPIEVNLVLKAVTREFQGITSQGLAKGPEKLGHIVEQVAQKPAVAIEAQRHEQAVSAAGQAHKLKRSNRARTDRII